MTETNVLCVAGLPDTPGASNEPLGSVPGSVLRGADGKGTSILRLRVRERVGGCGVRREALVGHRCLHRGSQARRYLQYLVLRLSPTWRETMPLSHLMPESREQPNTMDRLGMRLLTIITMPSCSAPGLHWGGFLRCPRLPGACSAAQGVRHPCPRGGVHPRSL